MHNSGQNRHNGIISTRRNVALIAVSIIASASGASAFAFSQHQTSGNTPDTTTARSKIAPASTSIGPLPEESQEASVGESRSKASVTVNGTAIEVPEAPGSTDQIIPTPGGSVHVQVDTETSTDSTQTFSSGSSSVNVQINSNTTITGNSASNAQIHIQSE